ncbi:DUF3570 domain-containing protein [Sandaracinomonas limnophila]|uniref:DUF3570 domain-containing protein n=1 Tax=Sandaracinomonas limnophila TaxID=1862386 RepID=A0A437PR91_9BACT|nr:DUF3570 domain-containing protein [Sandaracinomonas limnophila]RVU24783.1 DUF3570 domain-containing protein [Sandaracinomonas limnophila]
MKKVILAIGLYASFLHAGKAQLSTYYGDTTNYKSRKLKFEEANIVTGYYFQDGNNSAITGGIGTEKLTDLANSFDITFSKLDRYNRLHTLNVDFNIDRYTSASSDNIDPLTKSSASKEDTHIYPSINWSVKDDVTRTTKSLGYAFSTEYDYRSHGFNGGITFLSKDKNTEYALKGSAYLDTYMCILPSELRPADYPSGAHRDQAGIAYKPRNTFSGSFSIAQVINQRLQVMGIIEPGYQEGLLSTPFHRVYFTNGNHTTEKLPSTKIKLPVGLRLSYFAGDKVVVRGFYRFYIDNWGMVAHTANLEIPYKISPFFSVMPFYRVNNQTASKYFNKYGMHDANETYYTSDYDLSTFISEFVGMGVRMAPPGGIAKVVNWNSMELRYGYYHRSNGMVGHSVSLQIKIK